MAYGDESFCERSDCDCKKAMLRKTIKKKKIIIIIIILIFFEFQLPT